MTMTPNQSPEPTAVGAAVAIHAANRRWLSFGSLGRNRASNRNYAMKKTIALIFAASTLILAGCAWHFNGLDDTMNLIGPSVAFQEQHHRWPKDYTELSVFVQQSNGEFKIAHFKQVVFTDLQDGSLKIDTVGVETNRNNPAIVYTNKISIGIGVPKITMSNTNNG